MPSSNDESSRQPQARPGPIGGRRDTNRRERLDGLVSGALRIALERGVDNLTVDHVASTANLSKAGFYRYFSQLDQVVTLMVQPLIQALDEAFESSRPSFREARTDAEILSAYHHLAVALGQGIAPHFDVLRLFLQERRGSDTALRRPLLDVADVVRARTLEFTELLSPTGFLKSPPQMTTLIVLGATYELIGEILDRRVEIDPVTASLLLTDMLLHGVRNVHENGRSGV